MLYKLEKRGTSLAMPTTLYNFLMQNHINYTYDFEQSGIQLDSTWYQYILDNYKPEKIKPVEIQRPAPKPIVKPKVIPNKLTKRKLF